MRIEHTFPEFACFGIVTSPNLHIAHENPATGPSGDGVSFPDPDLCCSVPF